MPSLTKEAPPTREERHAQRGTDLFTRDLPVRSESVRESDRSFEAVVTTEIRATIFDPEAWELIEEIIVSGGVRFATHVPLLRSHNRHSELDVVGHADSWRTESGDWLGRVYVAEPATEEDEVRKIWMRIKGGHLKAVSIGYRAINYADIPAGQTASIGGKEYTAGTLRLRVTVEAMIFELSLVAVGADANALIRGAVKPESKAGRTNAVGRFRPLATSGGMRTHQPLIHRSQGHHLKSRPPP